eukprot:Em0010g667a
MVGNFYVNSMFIGDNSMMRAGRLMEDGFEKLGVKAILAKDSINLANHLIGPNAPISTVAKEWARNHYGSRIRSSTLVPTHFAVGDKNADDTSSWVDLLMLGGSQAMVHGDSSYATNAAFLRPVPIAMQSWILEDSERDCGKALGAAKLFDSMAKLKFKEEEAGQPTKEAAGMYSKEGEYVTLSSQLMCVGQQGRIQDFEKGGV